MKHAFFSVFCLVLFLFGHFGLLGALEIELTGGMNNMTFHPDRVTPHSLSTNYKKFQNYPYGFGDFHLKGEVSDKMDFDIHVSRDNILQNTAIGRIKTTSDYFNVEFGLFAGLTDDFEKPEAGITGSIQLAYPGVAFLFIGGSSSLGTRFDFLSNNTRVAYEGKVGLWLPGVIPSFSINTKSYSNEAEDYGVIRDELSRMQVSVDFFAKNFPIILTLDAGYETLTRFYDYSDITDELNAMFVGAALKIQLSKPLRLIAGFEIPITYSAEKPMEDPDNRYKLYKFHGGFSYNIF